MDGFVPAVGFRDDAGTQRMPSHGRITRGVTLVETLVVVAVIGGVASLLLPAVQQARESARGNVCQNNLKQIGVGLQNYATARDSFPTGISTIFIRYYWTAQILPYLDENPLAGSYDYTVLFSASANKAAVQTFLPFMACPSSAEAVLQDSKFPLSTNVLWWAASADYAGSQGPSSTLWNAPAQVSYPKPATADSGGFFRGAVKPGEKGRRLSDITDGLSKSIAVIESADRPRVWAFGRMIQDSGLLSSPSNKYVTFCAWANSNQMVVQGFKQDLSASDPVNQCKTPGPQLVNGSNNSGIYSFHNGGAQVLYADGSVRFLQEGASADIVASQLTIKASDLVAGP
jgi:prepilin-type processing-associated H-X9-DG protein